MKLETWVSIASLALSAMFVALMISLYNFLIGPGGLGPQQVVDPQGLLGELVSISGAPAVILAGIAFAMSKAFGTKSGGLLLIAAGIVMIAGMAVTATMVPRIGPQFFVPGIDSVPYVFMAAGAGIIATGVILLIKISRRTQSLDDLR
jgi:hypothetical protein